jgi:hypothetical protein
MDHGITMLVAPLPGIRIIEGNDEGESGSVLGFRKGGDEVLFASWNDDKDVPMVWIPLGEFSPDPEAIMPPDIVPAEIEEAPAGEGTTEKPGNPFGRGPKKRPGLEG